MSKVATHHLSKAPPSEWKHLRRIDYVEDGVYRIELKSEDESVFETVCRISGFDMEDGEIQGMNFDSDEFGRQAAQGLIFAIPICQAIGAFHKAAKGVEVNRISRPNETVVTKTPTLEISPKIPG